MSTVILYGSCYGASQRYAKELSRRTGFPVASYQDYLRAPLVKVENVVYFGGLYAGGITGLKRTLRAIPPAAHLTLVTVGLADPARAENAAHIRGLAQRLLGAERFGRTDLFHLRGGIDYSRLSPVHRAMMAMLRRSLLLKDPAALSDEDRGLLETYGTAVDFTDLDALEPVMASLAPEAVPVP